MIQSNNIFLPYLAAATLIFEVVYVNEKTTHSFTQPLSLQARAPITTVYMIVYIVSVYHFHCLFTLSPMAIANQLPLDYRDIVWLGW